MLIGCAVFREVLSRAPEVKGCKLHIMDYGLHLTPRKMRSAIQEPIDALAVPHLVLIGFGLCGNGLVGLQSGIHTLVIPRVDDCIALFLGSRAARLRECAANPATYYLTPGWLECGGEPWSEHRNLCAAYGAEKADRISWAMYKNYRRLCFLAFTAEELERCRPRALQVAEFCRERFGMEYEERIGSDALMRRLLAFGGAGTELREADPAGEFVIVPPGSEVVPEPFMRNQEPVQEEINPCTTCTTK